MISPRIYRLAQRLSAIRAWFHRRADIGRLLSARISKDFTIEMLPIGIRAHLFTLSSRIDDRGLNNIPLVTLSDIFRIPVLGWKNSNAFIRQLNRFRQNLKSKNWSGVTTFYPRSTYLYYYYLLFWWGEYTGVLNELFALPGKSIIAELFIRYFIEIDRIIDSHAGSGLHTKESTKLKNTPAIRTIQAEMLSRLWSLEIPTSVKRNVCHRIWSYRKDCLSICTHAASRPTSTLLNILSDKENTAGRLFAEWASILCVVYPNTNDPALAGSSQSIAKSAGMAIQVIDDLTDLPVDHRCGVSNIFWEMLKETPNELQVTLDHLDRKTWNHMDWFWARQNLPITCGKAMRLFDKYISDIHRASRKPTNTAELCRLIGAVSLRSLGSAQA